MSEFDSKKTTLEINPEVLAKKFMNSGADAILVFDFSETNAEHEIAIRNIRKICDTAEVPVIAAGNVERIEDLKKLLYAGCQRVVLNFVKPKNQELLVKVSKKFGKKKIIVYLPDISVYEEYQKDIEKFAGMLLCIQGMEKNLHGRTELPILSLADTGNVWELLASKDIQALTGAIVSQKNIDLMEVKSQCKARGIQVNTFESKISWKDFKLNREGLIPCIVQDYQTKEVLMLAYMNQESFQITLNTGKMTYWSRSRQELWTKGFSSGHFQYIKSLILDCDNDTILAKVSQIGASCHTGNQSCFLQELMRKKYNDKNPRQVFENVLSIIKDRKIHPKEGSYTNYLFDKGIDKILKKVGEECTEIVIAAKNPDKEEIKYEIADFFYHIMVLMAEKDLTWDDITRELVRR